ncbi:VOC family protein [Comamonas odontotermitis]|uniref:VOC family protein n=1 Tax=Comamonas odontotermitis TaxID=379895 RepID=UPI003751C4E1
MKLGYTIIYVPQVSRTLEFFEKAFGLRRKFLHESGDYGELDTGETTLAFASHELGQANFPKGYIAASDSLLPLGVEIAFTTDDVPAAFDAAVAAGAKAIKSPEVKPWGQTIAYVRCPDGTLIELCTPMGE